MPNTPHQLAEEFPEKIDAMHALKAENAHFARLFDEYHEVNSAVHRAETNIAPTDDFNEEAMRRKRMQLKDEIWGMLKDA